VHSPPAPSPPAPSPPAPSPPAPSPPAPSPPAPSPPAPAPSSPPQIKGFIDGLVGSDQFIYENGTITHEIGSGNPGLQIDFTPANWPLLISNTQYYIEIVNSSNVTVRSATKTLGPAEYWRQTVYPGELAAGAYKYKVSLNGTVVQEVSFNMAWELVQ
jgi:hypothetical protein